jgi:hypothetical protein
MNLKAGIFDLDAGTYLTDEAEPGIPLGWDPVNHRVMAMNISSEFGWLAVVPELTHTFSTIVGTTDIDADYYFTQYFGDSRNIRQGRTISSIGPAASGGTGPGRYVIEYNLVTGVRDFRLDWPMFDGNEGPGSLGLITTSGYRVFPSRCDTPPTPSTCGQDSVFRLLSYDDAYSFTASLTSGLNAAGGLEISDFTNGLVVMDLEDLTVAFSRGQRLTVSSGEISDVFVADVSTGARTNLTTGFLPAEFKHLVAVFPQQDRIAFSTSVDGSNDGGVSSLYLMNQDGTGKTLIETLPYVGKYAALAETTGSKVLLLKYEDGAVTLTDAHFAVLDAATGTLSAATGLVSGLTDYGFTYVLQSMPCE